MRILFHDATSAFAYDAELMRRQGIGATEASVVRVAEGLSASHDVVVAQRTRKEPVSPHPGLRYVPLNDRDPVGGPPRTGSSFRASTADSLRSTHDFARPQSPCGCT